MEIECEIISTKYHRFQMEIESQLCFRTNFCQLNRATDAEVFKLNIILNQSILQDDDDDDDGHDDDVHDDDDDDDYNATLESVTPSDSLHTKEQTHVPRPFLRRWITFATTQVAPKPSFWGSMFSRMLVLLELLNFVFLNLEEE